MSAKDNLARAKEAYRLWDETKGGSAQAWMNLMAERVQFKSLGQGRPGLAFSQERHSREEMGEYFSGLAKEWKMHHYTPYRFIAEDNWVAMLGSCKWEHRETGKVVDTPKADFLEFEDGKVTRFCEFFDTFAAAGATQ